MTNSGAAVCQESPSLPLLASVHAACAATVCFAQRFRLLLPPILRAGCTNRVFGPELPGHFNRRRHTVAATQTHENEPEHGEHDIWVHMTPAMRKELKAEDSQAWTQVVGVLLLIISVGLVLAIFTASLSWMW